MDAEVDARDACQQGQGYRQYQSQWRAEYRRGRAPEGRRDHRMIRGKAEGRLPSHRYRWIEVVRPRLGEGHLQLQVDDGSEENQDAEPDPAPLVDAPVDQREEGEVAIFRPEEAEALHDGGQSGAGQGLRVAHYDETPGKQTVHRQGLPADSTAGPRPTASAVSKDSSGMGLANRNPWY